ncbi:doublecortin domain-containing protein 2C [Psammomys obesus]|uniref:doublecortin domain-containing protein 2C n=1 Tax=Psammomys obesus TaxID=48139 RepID=UPI0024535723|nr:doublecortin domain-containing protein 2C [Psammomys obesus]
MGTRRPYTLVDTTPAKTILVYRNGDQFYVGRKFVFSRRRVANFEALLEQLTEQVEVPFGVRRLYTPTQGHQVLGLDTLQAGGKYVAAGRERFKKLDYIQIVPRKPAKMRKLKEIKPVVHCDINVPSRWQTQKRTSRHMDPNSHLNAASFHYEKKLILSAGGLATVKASRGGEVIGTGDSRQLFGLLVESKGKESLKTDSEQPKSQDSVYYAKEKKKTSVTPLIQSGAGDVYKAQTPAKEIEEALEVREDPEVKVEMPVDQVPAEMVKEIDGIGESNSGILVERSLFQISKSKMLLKVFGVQPEATSDLSQHLSRTSARIKKWFRLLVRECTVLH